MAAEMNLEPGKGTSSYKVALASAAKSKTKPAPLDMSRSHSSAMDKDKDKTVTTPRGKIGHRRVDETGETLYKKTPSSALMSAIQLGIGFSVGRLSAKPERDVLMQDFALVETADFPSGGTRETPAHGFSDFSFKTYAPVAFRYFRELFKMKPDDFLVAVCNEPLQELSNSGASGALFYVTNDDEFIIKTVQHKEADFLQKLLPGYYLNLNQNKRTLLPKFFGLYCYQCSGKNIRLAIMNNLIPREFKIHMKYDLKGSTYKRKASKAERAKPSPTLKDLDFVNDHPEGLFLESDTYSAVIKIIQRDCRVLESFKIMDYSLLLGIHNLDEAAREAGQEKTTVTPSGRMSSSSEYPLTPQSPDDGPSPTRPSLSRSRSVKGREGFSSEWEAITLKDTEERPVGGIPARNNKGERLLLFIGIIDILQSYRLKKKLEHGWKALVHDGDTVSVHRPAFYSKRFQEFFANQVFKKIPGRDKISPRRKSVNRSRSMTETERLKPDLRREHSFEGSASERRSRALSDSGEEPAKATERLSNAKENLEGKFESAPTSRTSEEIHANEDDKTGDKKVAFLDPKEGTSHDLDHEQIDVSIIENQTTTTKYQTAVSSVSETKNSHTSRSPQVDAPEHALVAGTADNAAPLALSEESQIITGETNGYREKDQMWQIDEGSTPRPESTSS